VLVVIGHGASPDGKGWGVEIDKHPVVRMHDSFWQEPSDWGARCDYTVLPGPWGPKIYTMPTRTPNRAWMLYTLPMQRKGWKIRKAMAGRPIVPQRISDECRSIYSEGFVPTRGLCAIIMAHKVLKATDIMLIGFDSILSGVTKPYSQRVPKEISEVVTPGDVCNRRHHFELERECLFSWASEAKVNLVEASWQH